MSIWSHRDDLGSIAQTVCWALFGATSVTVGLRLYCRLRYGPRLGGGGGVHVDDIITVGCLGVLLTFCILLSAALPSGVGKHYDTLSAADQAQALKWNAILNAATPWLCTTPKFAIVSTLERILRCGARTRAAFWGLALACQASVVVLVVWGFAQCSPAASQWDPSVRGRGRCASRGIYVGLAWFTYVFSTALDVFFALYPVPSVLRLNMPPRARASVALSLSVSWFGVAISAYKFSVFPRLGAIMTTDPSYPLVYLSMTHFAEGSFLLMSTSLATLRPLYRGLRRQITARTRDSSSRSLSHGQPPPAAGGGGGGGGAGQSTTAPTTASKGEEEAAADCVSGRGRRQEYRGVSSPLRDGESGVVVVLGWGGGDGGGGSCDDDDDDDGYGDGYGDGYDDYYALTTRTAAAAAAAAATIATRNKKKWSNVGQNSLQHR